MKNDTQFKGDLIAKNRVNKSIFSVHGHLIIQAYKPSFVTESSSFNSTYDLGTLSKDHSANLWTEHLENHTLSGDTYLQS